MILALTGSAGCQLISCEGILVLVLPGSELFCDDEAWKGGGARTYIMVPQDIRPVPSIRGGVHGIEASVRCYRASNVRSFCQTSHLCIPPTTHPRNCHTKRGSRSTFQLSLFEDFRCQLPDLPVRRPLLTWA